MVAINGGCVDEYKNGAWVVDCKNKGCDDECTKGFLPVECINEG